MMGQCRVSDAARQTGKHEQQVCKLQFTIRDHLPMRLSPSRSQAIGNFHRPAAKACSVVLLFLFISGVAVPQRQWVTAAVRACKKLLKKTSTKIHDYNLIEMHEDFAAQYLACEKDLDLQCWHLGNLLRLPSLRFRTQLNYKTATLSARSSCPLLEGSSGIPNVFRPPPGLFVC